MAEYLPKGDKVGRVLVQVQDDLVQLKKRLGDIAEGPVDAGALDAAIRRTEDCIKNRAEEYLKAVNKQVLTLPIIEENERKTPKIAKWWPPLESIPYIHPQKCLIAGPSPGEKHKAAFTMRILYNPRHPKNRELLHQSYGIQLPDLHKKTGSTVGTQKVAMGPNSLLGLQNSNLFPVPTPCEEDMRTELDQHPSASDHCLVPIHAKYKSSFRHQSEDSDKNGLFEKVGKQPRDKRCSKDVTTGPICPFTWQTQTPPPSAASDSRHLPYTSARLTALTSQDIQALAPARKHCFSIVEGHVDLRAVDFCAFKEHYCLCFGTVLQVLRQLERLLRQYAVPYARVCGEQIVALALSGDMQLQAGPKNLLSALENREEVLEIIKRPGQRYNGEGGLHAAAGHIQACWRCYHVRTTFLYMQRCKSAARSIGMSWLKHAQMSLVRRRLQATRLHHLENYHSRAASHFCCVFSAGQCLAANWNRLSTSKRTIIHIPSLGYSEQQRRRLGRFELLQSAQMGRLCDIIDENVEVIYVSPVLLDDDLVHYYTQLMGLHGAVEGGKATASTCTWSKRFTILTPEAYQHFPNHLMCASTLLKYSPHTLRRIKNLIRGKQAYIVSGVPHTDDLAVADELEVPVLGPEPAVAQLYGTKSGARRIFSSAGVSMPPGCANIYTLQQLHKCFAKLMAAHLEVKRWLFKMDGELCGHGTAYCDVFDVSFRPWALQEYHRHGPQLWKMTWAQERVLEKFEEAVPDLLASHAKPFNTSCYSSWTCFLEHFLKKGGVIEAYPPSDSVKCLTVDLLVDPGGTVHMLSCGDQLHGPSGQDVAGCFIPQSSVCPIVLQSISMRVGKACYERNILGYLSLDLVTFLETDTLDQQVWAVDLDLGYSNQLAMTKLMLLITGGTLDCYTGRLDVPHPLPDSKPTAHKKQVAMTRRFAVMSNRLFHTNLSMIHYDVFLQTCKAQGIGFDTKAQQGSLFALHAARNSLGMITISLDLQGALLTFARNLSVIHQEISAPNMQGETNFKDLIKSIEKVLHITRQNNTREHKEEEKCSNF